MMRLSSLADNEIINTLEELSKIIGGKTDSDSVFLIARNLKKYHGNLDEGDLRKSVEFALNGLIEVNGRPWLSIKYISSCINAYRDKQCKDRQYESKDYEVIEKSETLKNKEILSGLEAYVEKYSKQEDPEFWIPAFYYRWTKLMGVDLLEYGKGDLEYYRQESEKEERSRHRKPFAENIYKREATLSPDAGSWKIIVRDFFDYCIANSVDVKSLIKL